MKKYKLKEEHKAQFESYTKRWIDNALSTKPMDEDDKIKCIEAVKALYTVSGLTPPPDSRIVFVSSPMQARIVAGLASAIWYLSDNKDKANEINLAPVELKPSENSSNDWFYFPYDMAKISSAAGVGKFGVDCMYRSDSLYQGGNQWSSWECFLSFFKDVVKLSLDYSKYIHWETLALHGGPRFIHKDFCIISDRPIKLLIDSRNRPHNPSGPFCEWADGSKLYSINGIRVPMWVCDIPAEELKADAIMKIQNVDARREALRKMGLERFLKQTDAKEIDRLVVNHNGKSILYQLLDISLGDDITARVLKMDNPSVNAVHVEGVEETECNTVKQALAWRNGFDKYYKPESLS